MEKSPIDMDYNELDNLLDSLLKAENLPHTVEYRSDMMNYHRYSKFRLLTKALYRSIEADLFYRKYIKKRIISFKKEEFFKSFRLYFYIFKIGLTDLIANLSGKFDNKLPANYIIAAMLYDASCDIPNYRKYLKGFDAFIMNNVPVEPKDEYLTLFKESVDYVKNAVDKETLDTFINYIKIEHIGQLMSIYQQSDKSISRDNLFKITLAKGGITVMAGMYLMLPNLTKKQIKAIYEIGGVVQIFEDINDIKEDLKMGIQTLPNQKLIDYQELKQLYFGTVNNLIEKCDFDPNHPSVTLDIFYWLADVILERRYSYFAKIK